MTPTMTRYVMAAMAVMPLVVVSFLGPAGCSGGIYPSSPDASADSGPPSQKGSYCRPGIAPGECDAPPPPPDIIGCEGPPPILGMALDGVSCTVTSMQLGTQVPPDGRTWSLLLSATCGSVLSRVDVQILSKDDQPYPQNCAASNPAELIVTAAELTDDASAGGGDASTSYSAVDASGSCVVAGGPTMANETIPVSLTATIANDAGTSRVLSIGADIEAGPPPTTPLSIDGIPCTTADSPYFTSPTPTDPQWSVTVSGTCGAYRDSEFFIRSRADIPYPQPCGPSTVTTLFTNRGQPCQKYLATPNVTCTVTTGPSLATDAAFTPVTVKYVEPSGKTHTVVYTR